MTVSPVSGTETVLGETVSRLQEDIASANGGILGLSKYVDGFTGFSTNPAEQYGNYLVLQATAREGSTISAQVVGGTGGKVVSAGGGVLVVRITSDEQQIKFTTVNGDTTTVHYFNLTNLTLEDPEAFSITLAAGGNCTKTGDYQVYEGETATITLAADTGYALPATISVSGAAYTYDNTTGVVVINGAVENITVTCVCTAIEYAITTSVTNGSYSGDTYVTVAQGGTVTITPASGYTLPSSVTVTGADDNYSYDSTTGVVTIGAQVGAVSIAAECEAEQPQPSALTPFEVGDNFTQVQFASDISDTDMDAIVANNDGTVFLAATVGSYPFDVINVDGGHIFFGTGTGGTTFYNATNAGEAHGWQADWTSQYASWNATTRVLTAAQGVTLTVSSANATYNGVLFGKVAE